jgi:peptidoglycan-associated lipoprotein
MPHYRWLVLILVLMLILPACAKKEAVPVIEEVEEPPPPPPLEEVEEPEEEPVIEEEKPIILEDIFFDFDKFNIKDEYKKVLAANAEILLDHPETTLLVEGHCDERGTNEYNIALGEKRAKVVMEFYIAYGVPSQHLSMVSYGEERPFDYGHNEEAWAKNRRAHMVIR